MKILDVPRSGSYADKTSSHNRYGQYVRARSIPVNPSSSAQGTVRGRLATNAAAWRALTDTQRAGWESLAGGMTRTDALGQTYTLNGFAAYCSVNNNNLAAGDAVVSTAPGMVSPSAVVLGAITLTAAAFTIAYTPTPLAAGNRIFIFCSPQRSAGRSFEADYRLILVSAAAAASPANPFSNYQARLGTPVTGQKIFISVQTFASGFLSGPVQTSVVVS